MGGSHEKRVSEGAFKIAFKENYTLLGLFYFLLFLKKGGQKMKLKMLPIMLIVLLVLKLCLAISCNAQNLTLPFHGYIDYDGDAFSIANAGSGTWANGIVGSSSSVNGKGIYGLANSNLANITNYGGYFEAKGGKARAVYGEAKNSGNIIPSINQSVRERIK